jgi:hypothetical protein
LLGCDYVIRPAEAVLKMFDNTDLKTVGMITVAVVNPRSDEHYTLDFYIVKSHQKPILGSQASQMMNFFTWNVEYILAMNTTAGPLTMQDVNLQSVDSVKSCEKPDFELCIEREPHTFT